MGKTTILQRVCDTTESPLIYRYCGISCNLVRHYCLTLRPVLSHPTQVKLDPSTEVSDKKSCLLSPLTLSQRGEHEIDDELVFSKHKGYIFHDSRGIECGSTEELNILKGFIQRKAAENRLPARLHAIWFGLLCIYDGDL